MHFPSPSDLTARAARTWPGPVLVILCEDVVEAQSTLDHHAGLGFGTIVLALPQGVPAPPSLAQNTHTLAMPPRDAGFTTDAVNTVAAALPEGTWLGYVYNAEYLFYPFCETRSVAEATRFCEDERRDTVLGYTIDLYPAKAPGTGVDLQDAHIDGAGYYALARHEGGRALERQLDFYGGLRWRFEEHVPWERRRIDRVALWRTAPGVSLRADHTLSDPERNTYEGPYHHALSAAICSFRAAKALATNPGSKAQITTFAWHNSVPFTWHSRQLLEAGLIEPGQWF
jgi:hypothetical protein